MKRFFSAVTVAAMVGCLSSGAFAQSSGSFTASYGSTACAIDNTSGVLSGGISSLPPVTVKVSSGSGVALEITPSLVTGLYTNNKLSANNSTSTQNVGIKVQVAVDGGTANVIPELGSDGVVYDQRFMQISSSFLNALAACSGDNTCFQLVESTLSAHAFNFYVSNLSSGTHQIAVSWTIQNGGNGEAACVGPGTLTVQQVKNFSFNSPIGF